MPVTAKDIARELELSQPTVSRILSGDSNHRAAARTRERVWEAARRLGYQPNAVASSLRRGRTGIVGLHTSHNYDVRNDFMGEIVGSLQCACRAHDLDILLHSALQMPTQTPNQDSSNGNLSASSELVISDRSAREMFGKLRDGRIDGLILHAASEDPLVGLLRKSSFPVVVVADPIPDMAAVTSDDAGGMQMLIDHLWERGYRHFAFVAPRVIPASVERRHRAFDCALRDLDVAGRACPTVAIDYEHVEPALPELLELAKQARARGERLAVCCWNDRTAHNLLSLCARHHIAVPAVFAVTGFDGFPDDKRPARQLATAVCPWERVAETALDLLRARIDARQQKRPRPAPEEVRLPVELRTGDTT